MRWQGPICCVGVGPFQRHEPLAAIRCLQQQFGPALSAREPDYRQWMPLQWMFTGNRDHLGEILEVGSVTRRQSARA